MNTYKYAILISPIIESEMLSFMEGRKAKLITKIPIEVESNLSEKKKIKELKGKIGMKTPDGKYEFVGYEDLVKVIK